MPLAGHGALCKWRCRRRVRTGKACVENVASGLVRPIIHRSAISRLRRKPQLSEFDGPKTYFCFFEISRIFSARCENQRRMGSVKAMVMAFQR